MAFLDVSFLMQDPTFADPVTFYDQTVSLSRGRQTLTLTNATTENATVQEISEQTLERFPELASRRELIEVYRRGPISIADDGDEYTTIMDWRGYRYQAHKKIGDMMNYGTGHTEAVFIRIQGVPVA